MTARGHQELQAGTVPLAGSPREMTPRLAIPGRDPPQIAYGAVGPHTPAAPGGVPPAFPARTACQLAPRPFGDLVNVGEFTHAA